MKSIRVGLLSCLVLPLMCASVLAKADLSDWSEVKGSSTSEGGRLHVACGEVFWATPEALYRLNGTKSTRLKAGDGVPQDKLNILSSYLNSAGIHAIGENVVVDVSRDEPLYVVLKNDIRQLCAPDGTAFVEPRRNLAFDTQSPGLSWLVSWGKDSAGLYKIEAGKVTRREFPKAIHMPGITSSMGEPLLWSGTGIWAFEGEQFTEIEYSDGETTKRPAIKRIESRGNYCFVTAVTGTQTLWRREGAVLKPVALPEKTQVFAIHAVGETVLAASARSTVPPTMQFLQLDGTEAVPCGFLEDMKPTDYFFEFGDLAVAKVEGNKAGFYLLSQDSAQKVKSDTIPLRVVNRMDQSMAPYRCGDYIALIVSGRLTDVVGIINQDAVFTIPGQSQEEDPPESERCVADSKGFYALRPERDARKVCFSKGR